MSKQTITALFAAIILTAPGPSSAEAANRITVLYDAFGPPSGMKKDWGFAALVEYDGKRILFDTGNNADIFAHNIETAGVDLTKLDFVIISHRHGDHIGGVSHLLDLNPTVEIYAPKENFGVFGAAFPGTFYRRNESLPPEMRYFDGNPPPTLRFGAAWPQGRFTWVGEATEVAPGFHIIALKGDWGADLELVELSLAIDTPDGIVLVVGCSHPTIERIVEAASQTLGKPIHLVIGGTHLLPASDDEVRRIAMALRDDWKVAWIAPAHCTGEPAFQILKQAFGDRYIYAGLGTTLGLGPNPIAGAEAGRPPALFDDADRQTYRVLSRREPLRHDDGVVAGGADFRRYEAHGLAGVEDKMLAPALVLSETPTRRPAAFTEDVASVIHYPAPIR